LEHDICASSAMQVRYAAFFINKCGSHKGELSTLMLYMAASS